MGGCLFKSVKLTKNVGPGKYSFSGFGIGFDTRGEYSLPDSNIGKNIIISGVDMNSSVHIDNKGKDISILGKGPTRGFDGATLTAEARYSINFTQSNRKVCLSLHYNGSNNFLFTHTTKICQFKGKDVITKISL